MTHDFVLLDNTYCSGLLSADGHQWADSAIATDYMEKSFAGFPRSYPDGMDDGGIDALVYAPTGFDLGRIAVRARQDVARLWRIHHRAQDPGATSGPPRPHPLS